MLIEILVIIIVVVVVVAIIFVLVGNSFLGRCICLLLLSLLGLV